jgi:cell division protein FtsX
VRLVSEHPWATAGALAIMTATLFVVGLVALAADRIDGWSQVRRGGASMVVYLGSLDEPHARAFARELGALSGVERVDYVAPTESARRLERALGGDEALLDGIDRASIPASLEVTLAPGVADVIAMSPTMRALRDTPGVDDVVVEDRGANRFAEALATASRATWSIAAVLASIAVVVALATLRARLACTRRERDVLRLLGAGSGFHAVPSALAGAALGAVTAVLAAAAVVLVVDVFGDGVARALAEAVGSIELTGPARGEIAMFVGMSALLGAFGGALAKAPRAAR